MKQVSQEGGHMIYGIENGERVSSIFADWDETIIWSCLQGVMGHIYANDKSHPDSAMAILGDFCFFAGRPDRELVAYKPEWVEQDFIIAVPKDWQWAEEIERHYTTKAKRVIRYAMKKETDIFDKDKLLEIVRKLPSRYTITLMDDQFFDYCKKEKWSKDLVSQYEDYTAYQALGLGAVVIENGIPVAGASSYSSYCGGIEIEIDTKEEYRRQGLASACGAKLILECLDRGIYPSWDAQNLWSVGLAEKLGYHFSHEYDAYEILGY